MLTYERNVEFRRTLVSVGGISLAVLRAGVGDVWPFGTFPQFLDVIYRRGTSINGYPSSTR